MSNEKYGSLHSGRGESQDVSKHGYGLASRLHCGINDRTSSFSEKKKKKNTKNKKTCSLSRPPCLCSIGRREKRDEIQNGSRRQFLHHGQQRRARDCRRRQTAGEAISPFSRAHQEIARARINDRLLALAKTPVSPLPESDRQCAKPATASQLQLGRASCMADRKSRL